MLRSPTFFVGAELQKGNLEILHRREQQLAEAYYKNKPLCFNARAYQKTHPVKAQGGQKDADATISAPLILGVADGVSQIEDFGIDASLLPNELLKVCEELGMHQLVPDIRLPPQDCYRGPTHLLRRAFEATDNLGSLTIALALMDNGSKMHGKLHPMIGIVTVGDCEVMILRRTQGRTSPLQVICATEMQRIDGHAQTPLQLARVDDRIDPGFHEGITIEVIEKGSAVHCVSAYEGDILILGSDGVFDNLFRDEISELCNQIMPPGYQVGPVPSAALSTLARNIIEACHMKTRLGPNGTYPEAPIGRGGKKDDTSVVVGEIIEWTEAHARTYAPRHSLHSQLSGLFGKLIPFESCCRVGSDYDSDEELDVHGISPVDPWNYDTSRQAEADPLWAMPPVAAVNSGALQGSHQPLTMQSRNVLPPGQQQSYQPVSSQMSYQPPGSSWTPPLQQNSWTPSVQQPSYQQLPMPRSHNAPWGSAPQVADAYKSSYMPQGGLSHAGTWHRRQ